MIYRLTIKDGFAAAHRLAGSGGKCESLHGHNFGVSLEVAGDRLDETGMLMDFGDLKEILKTVLAQLDHSDLNEHPEFSRSSPSSENIARFIWHKVSEAIDPQSVTVVSVTVNESETASAKYVPV
ncbi:MAG: 6-carboxytetrahydropterin synthase QueD [bacterium]|nr:6-carboxytetrahydropterin synthase QueD [bacterium]MDT8366871.1 6-carboxytetrahydropterin synthase QueD [bacterium]